MPDDVSDTVDSAAPYRDRTGRDTLNADDRIFSDDAVLTIDRQGPGYRGLINLGVTL
jgi:hypothetical protein